MPVITKYLKASPSGPDEYALMSTWEAAEQTDLVSDGDSHVLECDGIQITDDCGISDWTTGISNTITVKAASGHEHAGISRDNGGSGFRMSGTATLGVLRIGNNYVFIEDLEIRNTSTGNAFAFSSGSSNSKISRCIMKSSATGTSYCVNVVANTVNFTNCIFYTGGRIVDIRPVSSVVINNCTGVATGGSSTYGFLTDNLNTLTNCVSVNFGTGDFFGITSTDLDCASEDTTASSSTGGVTGVSLTDGEDFVEPSTGDYTPTSGGVLAGVGTDLSTDFLDDITGALR